LKNDAVHLRFPAKGRPRGGIQFLTTIVEHFAQDVKADLIKLGSEDFIVLVERFTGLVPDEGAKDHQDDGVPSKKAKSKHTKDT
jgi:hypothetical protein